MTCTDRQLRDYIVQLIKDIYLDLGFTDTTNIKDYTLDQVPIEAHSNYLITTVSGNKRETRSIGVEVNSFDYPFAVLGLGATSTRKDLTANIHFYYPHYKATDGTIAINKLSDHINLVKGELISRGPTLENLLDGNTSQDSNTQFSIDSFGVDNQAGLINHAVLTYNFNTRNPTYS